VGNTFSKTRNIITAQGLNLLRAVFSFYTNPNNNYVNFNTMSTSKHLIISSLLSLIGGALLVSVIIVFEPHLQFIYKSKLLLGPLFEETIKYSYVWLLIYAIGLRTSLIPFLGVGFGFTEALRFLELHGYTAYGTLWGHIVFGIVMAYFFHLAIKIPRLRVLFYLSVRSFMRRRMC